MVYIDRRTGRNTVKGKTKCSKSSPVFLLIEQETADYLHPGRRRIHPLVLTGKRTGISQYRICT